MARTISVGTATGRRGHYVYGTLATLPLPAGGVETWPVIIVQGDEGPVLWLTANIHGGEVTGVAAIHDLLTPDLPRRLRGTLVVLPTLNPTGLNTMERRPFYDDHDPNRLFPMRRDHSDSEDDESFPSPYSIIAHEIAQAIKQTADYLIDLHCAWTLSLPFVIRDRVLYREERDRPQAEKLQRLLDGLVRSYGLAVVNEYPARKYIKQELNRSVAGYALNELRIPAFTVELGATGVVDPTMLQAGVQGLENVLKWLGMLPGTLVELNNVPVPVAGYPVCREEHPRAPASGLATFRVKPGDLLREGDIIASLRDIYGRPIGDGVVRTEKAGWVIGLAAGMPVYRHTYLTELAVRDTAPLLVRYPG